MNSDAKLIATDDAIFINNSQKIPTATFITKTVLVFVFDFY